jgi:hypothetical protein
MAPASSRLRQVKIRTAALQRKQDMIEVNGSRLWAASVESPAPFSAVQHSVVRISKRKFASSGQLRAWLIRVERRARLGLSRHWQKFVVSGGAKTAGHDSDYRPNELESPILPSVAGIQPWPRQRSE